MKFFLSFISFCLFGRANLPTYQPTYIMNHSSRQQKSQTKHGRRRQHQKLLITLWTGLINLEVTFLHSSHIEDLILVYKIIRKYKTDWMSGDQWSKGREFLSPGANLIKKFQSRIATSLWNSALWFDFSSHVMTWVLSNQSRLFQTIVVTLLWISFMKLKLGGANNMENLLLYFIA